ncbi:hypothetical protein EV192_10748 [Actinocrispum wychmicini]|uniref:Uncharacterized protein n=1 Tax=Actinocrispum wychmicini TaxID=1213861 RepID=A0A4R2JB88_9PSEU|nr:hypothetical protein EV192_10748 [Actinocrispum wychmicini]
MFCVELAKVLRKVLDAAALRIRVLGFRFTGKITPGDA